MEEKTNVKVQAVGQILGQELAVLLDSGNEGANLGNKLGLGGKVLGRAVDNVALECAAHTLLGLGLQVLLEGAQLALLRTLVSLNQLVQESGRGGVGIESEE